MIELVAPGAATPLNDIFAQEDGVNAKVLMAVKLIDDAIKGIQKGKDEILPGLSKMIRILSRIAPGFLISQATNMGASTMYGTN